MNNNGTSEAKRKGNKIHQHLKILALRWVKRNREDVLRELRRKARKAVDAGA